MEEKFDAALCKMGEEIEKSIVFEEELCNICEEVEKSIVFDDAFDDDLYNLCDNVETNINESTLETGGLKRRMYDNITDAKKPKYEDGASTSLAGCNSVGEEMMICSPCQILVCKRCLVNHYKSNFHKNNVTTSHRTLNNVKVVESSFGNRIISYIINSKCEALKTPKMFLVSIRDEIMSLFEELIQSHTIFKVNFVLHVDLIQETKNISNTKFQTYNYTVMHGDDINILFTSLCNTLITKISAFEKRKDSGWRLKRISCLDMNVNKFDPLREQSYIELPSDIRLKRAIINVKNNDNLSFKWALLAALYPVTKNSDRVSSYIKHSDKLNFTGVRFPVKITDISIIEGLNDISINVFGLQYDNKTKIHIVVGPLYLTKCRKTTHVNLLCFSSGSIDHFCYIKNLSRLVSSQVTNQEHAVYICDGRQWSIRREIR